MKSILRIGRAFICLFLALTQFYSSSNAQTAWDTLPWKSKADYKLQPLNKNYIPTGILYDRVFPYANVDEHIGDVNSTDTTTPGKFMQSYYEMYNASYNTNGWISPNNLNTLVDSPFYNAHPIGIFYYKFNAIDTNALQDHLLDTLSNGQFIDVANPQRSPYFTKTGFLASPLIAEDQVFEKGNHIFYIDEQFFLHNEYLHISQIRVDFGNGQPEWVVDNPFDINGSRITSNIISSISVLVGSSLSGRILVVGADFLGNAVLYGNPFQITVKDTKEYAPLTICKGLTKMVIEPDPNLLAPINSQYSNPQLDYTTTISQNCGGVLGALGFQCKVTIPVKDTAYIYFAGNGSNCGSQVRRPIVFLDGFDPTNDRDVKKIYENYINARVERNGNPNILFGDYMLNQGYDFIILDFKHGNDLLERNAMTVVKLLQDLYQAYGANFQQDITIIGPSMGSMIAQYALAYMEHNNMPHHVKTYISFDGPHQGANVPIGVTKFYRVPNAKRDFFQAYKKLHQKRSIQWVRSTTIDCSPSQCQFAISSTRPLTNTIFAKPCCSGRISGTMQESRID
jgi:hypothetical protein